MAAIDYDESITSLLYPGNTLSQHVLVDAIWALERIIGVGHHERSRLCLRLDAGFGTDDNLNWLLRQGYQLVAKNNSGRRAGAWGARITEWEELEVGRRWVAVPAEQLQFCVPTRTLAVRWLDTHKNSLKHALYVVTDLLRPPRELCQEYDLRGGLEVDIKDDKQGLLLTHRRRRRWHAQEMLLLLNDLAHNLLSMLRQRILVGTPLADYGPYRLIRDVLNIPGEVIAADGHLVELHLLSTHPLAFTMADVLPRLWR